MVPPGPNTPRIVSESSDKDVDNSSKKPVSVSTLGFDGLSTLFTTVARCWAKPFIKSDDNKSSFIFFVPKVIR